MYPARACRPASLGRSTPLRRRRQRRRTPGRRHSARRADTPPINPIRVLDTRIRHGSRTRLAGGRRAVDRPDQPGRRICSGAAAGSAAAVVLNITMVDPDGATFATVWPTGSAAARRVVVERRQPHADRCQSRDRAGRRRRLHLALLVAVRPTTSSTSRVCTSMRWPRHRAASSRSNNVGWSTPAPAARSVRDLPRSIDLTGAGVPATRRRRDLERHGDEHGGRRLPHGVADEHADAARVEPQRARPRRHGGEPGDRPSHERCR